MQPIQELISKIRWDPVYADREFEIGFLDKLAHREIRIPFKNIQFVRRLVKMREGYLGARGRLRPGQSMIFR